MKYARFGSGRGSASGSRAHLFGAALCPAGPVDWALNDGLACSVATELLRCSLQIKWGTEARTNLFAG